MVYPSGISNYAGTSTQLADAEELDAAPDGGDQSPGQIPSGTYLNGGVQPRQQDSGRDGGDEPGEGSEGGETYLTTPYGDGSQGAGTGMFLDFGEPQGNGEGVSTDAGAGDDTIGGDPVSGTGSGGTANAPAITHGEAYVESLRDGGQLPPERATEILADPRLLAQLGTLAGDGSDPAGTRAADVLIGLSGSAPDRHLAGLVRAGLIDPAQFTALANDIGFLQSLEPHLQPGPDGAPANPGAAALLVDQALGNLAGGQAPTANEGEVFMSRDGLPFVVAPPAEAVPAEGGDAMAAPATPATPLYIGRDGQPLPPDMQTRLAASAASGEPMDPALLRGAQALTGQVELSPTEQFATASYSLGAADTDIFLSQINDPAFLESPQTARAAESLFGTSETHSKADDFVNKLFVDGHIDQTTFIEHTNDGAFLAETDAAITSGTVTYTTGNFGQVDEMLGMSDQQISDTLAPGFDIDEGPPSPEQIVALYEAGGRGDHQFVELAVNYTMVHNPGLELQFGHKTQADSDTDDPVGFFWTKDGAPIEDPFLDSLTSELDGSGDTDVSEHFHRQRKPYVDGDRGDNVAPISVPVRLKFEGVSGESRDENTDASRHTVGLVFPGMRVEDVVSATTAVAGAPPDTAVAHTKGYGVTADGRMTGAFGIDVDDHYTGGADYPGGIDGKARQALEVIDPNLFGTQITQVDGVDGFEVTNETRFDNTVVSANDTDGLTVDLADNSGNYTLQLSNSTDPTLDEGAGQGTVFVPPDGRSVVDGFAYRNANAGTEVPGSDEPTTEADEDSGGTPSVTGLTFNGGAHSSVSNTNLVFGGDVADVTINGDDGAQTVEVHGEFSDSTVHGGDGSDTFVAHDGATVSDTDIFGDDGRDRIVQLEGATYDGVEVQGGDGGDLLSFAGHNTDVSMDPGDNGEIPDEIALYDTVTGDLFAEDGEGSTYEVKSEDFDNHDIIKLYGDGWEENGDGYGLRNEDGSYANLVIGGNADNFEEVGIYDPVTGEEIEQLKYIEPEIIMSNQWMSWTSTALKIVGMLPIPGAQVALLAGVAMEAAYKIDNGMTSFGDLASTALGAVPGGAAATYAKAGISFGINAAEGDWEGAALSAIPFVPGVAGDALQGAYSTYRFGDSIAEGDVGGAFSHAGGAVGSYGGALGNQDVADAGRITHSVGKVYDGVEDGNAGQIVAGGAGIYQGTDGLLHDEPERIEASELTQPQSDAWKSHSTSDGQTNPIEPYDPNGFDADLHEGPLEYSYS